MRPQRATAPPQRLVPLVTRGLIFHRISLTSAHEWETDTRGKNFINANQNPLCVQRCNAPSTQIHNKAICLEASSSAFTCSSHLTSLPAPLSVAPLIKIIRHVCQIHGAFWFFKWKTSIFTLKFVQMIKNKSLEKEWRVSVKQWNVARRSKKDTNVSIIMNIY